MNYRRDVRSKAKFKKDIKQSTVIEQQIIERWLTRHNQVFGTNYRYRHNGCGNDGQYLEDHQVNCKADFYITGLGRVEVKFSRPLQSRVLHLKVKQVTAYLRQKAHILLVNGWDTSEPVYTVIRPPVLQAKKEGWQKLPFKGFGWKQAYRIPVKDFIWRPL